MPYDPYNESPVGDFEPDTYGGGFSTDTMTPATAVQPEPEVNYARDIAPAARKLFEDIGSDKNMSWQQKSAMQQQLIGSVGNVIEQRAKIDAMRQHNAMNRMRVEREGYQLESLRNQRAQVQANQSKLAEVGKQINSVMDLPVEAREQALAEIEARNFDVLSVSPTAGARIESIRRTYRPTSQLQGGMFGGDSEKMKEFIADNVDNPDALRAALLGDVVGAGVAIGAKRIADTKAAAAKATAEDSEKNIMRRRIDFINKVADQSFELDFEEDDDQTIRRKQAAAEGIKLPRYMSPKTHVVAEQTVISLGSPKDIEEWLESDGLPDRDMIRAKLAQNVMLKARYDLLNRTHGTEPKSVGESLVLDETP